MATKTVKQGMGAGGRVRLVVLIVLLLAAVALIISKTSAPAPEAAPSAAPATTPAPTSGRTAREAAYDKDIAALERLIGDDNADAATRAQAGERLAIMVGDHQSELGIEEALIHAGFEPCLVLMQNGSLTVMINTRELSGAQSATILSVCAAHSDVAVENIRIMTAEGL